jgi:DNA polymerase I
LKQAVIIDAHSIAWKAFHSMRDMSYENIPTGVLYGFLLELEKLYHTFNPCSFLFAWDSKKSVRKLADSEYKQKRTELSESDKENREIAMKQMEDLRTFVLPTIGFNQHWRKTGFEADDVVAKLVALHDMPIVVSGDEDFFQLLESCSIYNHAKHQHINKYWFVKKYGIQPNDWILVKAIGGCTSDNVKGIPGVGEKKAIEYICGEMNPSTKTYQKIKDNQVLIEHCLQLVSLPHAECPELESRTPNTFNEDGFFEVCSEYGLDSLKPKHKQWEKMTNG